MEPQSGVRTWQWVVTVVIIIVLIIIGVIVFSGKGSGTPTDTDTNATTSQNANTGVNRITMTDQYPGNVVYISSVQLAKPGWVVIHKDNAGKPGDVIGSKLFQAGINPGSISLSSPMVDGQLYYAVLYNDDGDGKFDIAKDLPLKDASGNTIMKIFRGSLSASQEIKG